MTLMLIVLTYIYIIILYKSCLFVLTPSEYTMKQVFCNIIYVISISSKKYCGIYSCIIQYSNILFCPVYMSWFYWFKRY